MDYRPCNRRVAERAPSGTRRLDFRSRVISGRRVAGRAGRDLELEIVERDVRRIGPLDDDTRRAGQIKSIV
jgi:hypothetical protein